MFLCSTIWCSTVPPWLFHSSITDRSLFHHQMFCYSTISPPLFHHHIFYFSTICVLLFHHQMFHRSTIRCSTVPPSGVLKFHHLCSTVSPSLLRCSTISFVLLHHQMFHWSTTSEGVLTFRILQPVVLATWGFYNRGFLLQGFFTIRGSFIQGFLQPAVRTSRGLTTRGLYI